MEGVQFNALRTPAALLSQDVELLNKFCCLHSFDSLSTLDVDFFTAQISVLLVVSPATVSWESPHGLRDCVLQKCAESLHCATKYAWAFHAMAQHCVDKAMKTRCLEMSRHCEIAVVNYTLPHCTSSMSASLPRQPSQEFAMFLAKQQRSELFTAQLDLISRLEAISLSLLESSRTLLLAERKTYCTDTLRKRLAQLDIDTISDHTLYFPNRFGSMPHFRVLRIVAEECFALNSRDKVPFMLLCEIAYTGKLCSSSSIYEQSQEDGDLFHDKEDLSPSPPVQENNPFGRLVCERNDRIRRRSPYGRLSNWDVLSLIVKAGDDCRQENLAMQMIFQIHEIFKAAALPLWLRPFHVLVTSPSSGIIECVEDAVSIDSLKKSTPHFQTLLLFFEGHFGPRDSPGFLEAQTNFVQSTAAYSLVCYLLQIKDRHNGNILLDAQGHVIHIDFGFFLSNSPGGNWGFEAAPFKLTQEFVEVMEGEDSDAFALFKLLMIRGFLELRRHVDDIVSLVEIMYLGPSMDCFYRTECVHELRARFFADKTEQECIQFVYEMIETSVNNWRTVQYDSYQRMTNGIL